MTQALYRKWRPQTFDEVVGQEHVTQTLRNALTSGRIGHAYLFAGLRGTGKTTMARLLAKAVNCLAEDPSERPCNRCAICLAVNEGRLLDMIEIDAASHTGVDDVRELRDKISFRPNECRYKVYIIDEVHRFSGSAFDALLKTIEEPPEHAIFVLATTEIHKVPATILSRCQRFDFRRIPLPQIIQRLQSLVEAEGLSVEPEALALIARSATGSLRDAESLLDQLAVTGGSGVTLAQVQATLGTVDADLVASLVDSLLTRDVPSGLTLINRALEQGVDLRQFTRQIVEHLRHLLLIQLQGSALLDLSDKALQGLASQAGRVDTAALVQAVKRFNQAETELRGGWQPQLPLELALVEVIAAQDGVEAGAAPAAPASTAVREKLPPYEADAKPTREESKSEKDVAAPQAPAPPVEAPDASSGALTLQVLQRRWSQVLDKVKARDTSIQALLGSASPAQVQDETITLHVAHTFTRDKLNQGRAKQLVVDALSQVLGQSCRLEYKVVASQQEASAPDISRDDTQEAWVDDPLVKAAQEMGAEVKPMNEGRKA